MGTVIASVLLALVIAVIVLEFILLNRHQADLIYPIHLIESAIIGVVFSTCLLYLAGQIVICYKMDLPVREVYVNRCTTLNGQEVCGKYHYEDEQIIFDQDSTGRFDLKIKKGK